ASLTPVVPARAQSRARGPVFRIRRRPRPRGARRRRRVGAGSALRGRAPSRQQREPAGPGAGGHGSAHARVRGRRTLSHQRAALDRRPARGDRPPGLRPARERGPGRRLLGAAAQRGPPPRLLSAPPGHGRAHAYHDYVTDPSYATAVPIALEHPSVVVTRTLSKAYGMAGMRVGYAIGQPRAIENFNRWGITFNQNSLAVAAAVASLGDPAHIDAERARNTEARAFTTRF